MAHIILGSGAAGLNALETFRKYDQSTAIKIYSGENYLPYSRVLLPYYLKAKLSYEKLFIRKKNYFAAMNAEFFKDTAVEIDTCNKLVKFKSGKTEAFDSLLIATGSAPVLPPVEGLVGSNVHTMWTMADIKAIECHFQKAKHALVLGSSFVSMQAAWALVQRGLKVSLYELLPRIMPRVLDDKAADILLRKVREHGVNLKTGIRTKKIIRNSAQKMTVFAEGEKPLEVDFIVAGTGVRPNIDFLKNTEIEIDRGILVNEYMQTSIPEIYAAGDVAQGPIIFGEAQEIHALWPTAVEQGKIAGANMAGKTFTYQGSLNMNVTEVFGITVASIGRFGNNDGDQVIEFFDDRKDGYVKVVLQNEIPVGGIAVGSFEYVGLLGILRNMIKQKKRLKEPENIKKALHKKIVGGGYLTCG